MHEDLIGDKIGSGNGQEPPDNNPSSHCLYNIVVRFSNEYMASQDHSELMTRSTWLMPVGAMLFHWHKICCVYLRVISNVAEYGFHVFSIVFQSFATDLTSGCGSEKQCFLEPEGCSGSACEYAVTWTPNGDYVDFVVGTNVAALGDDVYIAVGVGPQPVMVSDPWSTVLLKLESLRWRHTNVMYSQITGHPTVCLTALANPHQRNKVRITGPFWGEFTGDRWIPRTKGQ